VVFLNPISKTFIMATLKTTGGQGTLALAAFDSKADLRKNVITRPKANDTDVHIDISYCGMCHSDLHTSNGDWYVNKYPISPGHEIAGIVREVGSKVNKFKKGDRVAVGCFVESCKKCDQCLAGFEQYCLKLVQTYSSEFPDGYGHDECKGIHTNGGYTSDIVVNEHFVFKVPDNIDLKYAAPLMCAGATTYSPLARNVLGKKDVKHVGVVGFGGLGQVAAKLALAMGVKVSILSRNRDKEAHAKQLGVELIAHGDPKEVAANARKFDVIIDTIAAHHEVATLINMLRPQGTYVFLGGVVQPYNISSFGLIMGGYKVEGSLVAGCPCTQEMLDFCSKHKIFPDIEVIKASEADNAFKQLHKGATSTRYVIDISTLKDLPDYTHDEKKQ